MMNMTNQLHGGSGSVVFYNHLSLNHIRNSDTIIYYFSISNFDLAYPLFTFKTDLDYFDSILLKMFINLILKPRGCLGESIRLNPNAVWWIFSTKCENVGRLFKKEIYINVT